MNADNRLEKLGLLALAGTAILSLAAIAGLLLGVEKVDANASGILGVIAAGLIAFGKDIISAIRGYAMSAQLGKVTDQLAASGPIVSDTPVPADAAEAAQTVAASAVSTADEITEAAKGN